MYLLDTQALADLLRGDDNTSRRFVDSAEGLGRDVYASMISFGILKAQIDIVQEPSARETWEKRFNVGLTVHRANDHLLAIDELIVLEWALLRNRTLPIGSAEQVGDDERLVVATAIIRRLALVTSTPERYKPIHDRGLLVHRI